MKKKTTWRQKILFFIWCCTIILPLFCFIRWIFSCIFLGLHMLFRSSAGVKKKQEEAYENFIQGRYEYLKSMLQADGYCLMVAVMQRQRSRYISVETLRSFMSLYLVDADRMRDLTDHGDWTMLDIEGIEQELGIKFDVLHTNDERTPYYEKTIGRDYRGEEYPEPSNAIGELVKQQMSADAASTPDPEFSSYRL